MSHLSDPLPQRHFGTTHAALWRQGKGKTMAPLMRPFGDPGVRKVLAPINAAAWAAYTALAQPKATADVACLLAKPGNSVFG
jgi:hypothetical protein